MKSLKIPFNYSGGKTQTTSSVKTAAEQKIIDVLVTNRLERVMRHRYGAGVGKLLFEPLDELSFADFVVDARQAIEAAVSQVTILDLRMSPTNTVAAYGNSETTMGFTVIYKLPLGTPQVVTFKVAIPESLTEESLI
jgi:phage baseplate assembly protein W